MVNNTNFNRGHATSIGAAENHNLLLPCWFWGQKVRLLDLVSVFKKTERCSR